MTAHEIVEAAVREVITAKGGTVPAALPPETSLTALPWPVRLEIVERVERALDGHVSTRLGDAYQLATVGELVGAVERALWALPCGRCGERLPVDAQACAFCESAAGTAVAEMASGRARGLRVGWPAGEGPNERRAPARAEV